MVKSKRLLVFIMLVLIVSLALVQLTGCKGEEETTTYKVTWSVPAEVTVTVEGQSQLPTEVEEGTTLVFTLTAKNGYTIDTVKKGSTTLRATNGKYTLSNISSDINITVSVSKSVESVAVTKNPTKLTYFVEEALETQGMEVTVTYVGGTKEVVTDYTVSPVLFTVGDTAFNVSYKGFTSADVALEKPVAYKGVIDTKGATVSATYLEQFADNPYYSCVDGVIVFGFTAKPSYTLPTEADLTKGEAGMFTFKGFTGSYPEELANTTFTANWFANIGTIQSVNILYDNGSAYLYVSGTYTGTFENVFTYLREGNLDIDFIGQPIEKEADSNKFTATLNLSQIIPEHSELLGPWLDIRIATEYDGVLYSNEVTLETPEGSTGIDYNPALIVADGDYTYCYKNWGTDGYNYLKLMISEYKPTDFWSISYEMAVEQKEDGVYAILTGTVVDGQGLQNFTDCGILVSWWGTNETEGTKATINGNGEFTLNINLTKEFAVATNMYAHVTLTDKYGNVIFGGDKVNLLVTSACKTELPKLEQQAGDVQKGLSAAMTDEAGTTYTYYVGAPAWDGLVGYVTEKLSYTMTQDYLGIENVEGKANLAIYGTVTGATEANMAAIKLVLDGQDTDNWGYNYVTGVLTCDYETKTYKVLFDISGWNSGLNYVLHLNGKNLWLKLFPGLENGAAFNISGVSYVFEANHNSWGMNGVILAETEEADSSALVLPLGSYATTSAKLQVVGEKVMYVISGTYENMTVEEMQAKSFFFDVQKNPYIVTGSWGGDWSRMCENAGVLEAKADGTWTYTVDITALEVYPYTSHFSDYQKEDNGSMVAADLKLPEGAVDTSTVNFNGKNYRLANTPGSEDAMQFWGCVGLWVEDASAPAWEATSAKLVKDDAKVLYVISGTYVNMTATDMEAIVLSFDMQKNNDISGQGWDRFFVNAGTFTVNADGTWAYTVDITEAGKCAYTTHFGVKTGSDAPDFKPDKSLVDETVVVLGEVQYRLVGGDTAFWYCIGVCVEDVPVQE